MSTAVRSGGRAALLAAVLGLSWALGAVLHPAFPGATAARGAPAPVPEATPGGPADGYALVPRTATLAPGRPGDYVFTVTGPAGLADPPRLAVVRRDAAALVRATAVPAADGTWSAPLTLPGGGAYRVLVDVTPVGGPPRTLAADLDAPGPAGPVPPPVATRVAEVDGYRVRLDGDLVAGAPSPVFATVGRAGAPVTDLEPLDGAFGRLTAVRVGDLAPARVPPAAPAAPGDRAGPGVAFTVDVPAAGTYRLFLDFRHDGAAHSAVFTVPTG